MLVGSFSLLFRVVLVLL